VQALIKILSSFPLNAPGTLIVQHDQRQSFLPSGDN